MEKMMREWLDDPDESLLKQICSKKYFYNSTRKEGQAVIMDSVLPLSESGRLNEFDVDLIFIPG